MIDGIVCLGEALGYEVRREHPVADDDGPGTPAVDVAWFNGPGQRFPLMIFEIESSASASMANNAIKVLSQESVTFEKPLFFFHVVLSDQRGRRIQNLEREFGRHNYRCYAISSTNRIELLRDVLAQHRRIAEDVLIGPLLDCLRHEVWSTVSVRSLLDLVVHADFAADLVPTLAQRALSDDSVLCWLVSTLLERDFDLATGRRSDVEYETYWGGCWGYPLHLGLAASVDADAAAGMAERWSRWQGSTGRMDMIGPFFGLDRDYDAFLIGLAPFALVLWSVQMPNIARTALKVLARLRDRLRETPILAVPNAIWTLHLSAMVGERSDFEDSASVLNELGGLSREYLYSPPAFFGIEGDEEWMEDVALDAIPVPTFEAFVVELQRRSMGDVATVHPATVSLHLLTRDVPEPSGWNLWSCGPLARALGGRFVASDAQP